MEDKSSEGRSESEADYFRDAGENMSWRIVTLSNYVDARGGG